MSLPYPPVVLTPSPPLIPPRPRGLNSPTNVAAPRTPSPAPTPLVSPVPLMQPSRLAEVVPLHTGEEYEEPGAEGVRRLSISSLSIPLTQTVRPRVLFAFAFALC